eukprot:Pgem_evm1s9986
MTNQAPSIPTNPFPTYLKEAAEMHFEKAKTSSEKALLAVRTATGAPLYNSNLSQFIESGLAREGEFSFDPSLYPLREAFLESCGLSASIDLNLLHEYSDALNKPSNNNDDDAVADTDTNVNFISNINANANENIDTNTTNNNNNNNNN